MAFKTSSGQAASAVGANGLVQFTTGVAPTAAQFNSNWADDQAPAMYGMLSGVLEGGAGITAAGGLSVSLAAGLSYYARQVWINDAAVTVGVADASTTWLWGCADGQIRQTTTSSPPSGWTARTACILAKVTSSGGAVTAVDLTAQEQARIAAARLAAENAPVSAPAADVIPGGASVLVPAGAQQMLMDSLLVQGAYLVRGKVKVF